MEGNGNLYLTPNKGSVSISSSDSSNFSPQSPNSPSNSNLSSPLSSISTSQFKWKKGKEIGCGSFGKVFKCLIEGKGSYVAAKEFVLSDSMNKQDSGEYLSRLEKVAKEIKLLQELNHENIVRYFGSQLMENDKKLYIFMEYMNESLRDRIKAFVKLDYDTTRNYSRQILQGLAYLHSRQIIHCDIKPENILVDTHGTVKLADFGLSVKKSELFSAELLRGTPLYMPPEVAQEKELGFAADIFSFGLTVIEMLVGKSPRADRATNKFAAIYTAALDLISLESLSEEARQFLSLCIQHDSQFRQSASNLLNHTFVKLNDGTHKFTKEKKEILTAQLFSSLTVSENGNFLKVGQQFSNLNVFQGREEEKKIINEQLRSQSVSYISLTGKPGIGKTILLSAVCDNLIQDFQGVAYVSCRNGVPVENLIISLGKFLTNNEYEHLDTQNSIPKLKAILDILEQKGKFVLAMDAIDDILLDNKFPLEFEEFFSEILSRPSKKIKIISTSRNPPRITMDQRAFYSYNIEGIDERAAIQILRDFGNGISVLQSSSESDLQKIAERCHYIPLALEKVAAILSEEPTLTISKLLKNKTFFNEKIMETLSETEWKGLTEDQQKVMQIFSIFNQQIPLNAVTFLTSYFFPTTHGEKQDDQILKSLLRKNLVREVNSRETFELHPMDQDYAYKTIPNDPNPDINVLRLESQDGISSDEMYPPKFTKPNAHKRAANFFERIAISEDMKKPEDVEIFKKRIQHLILAQAYQEVYQLISKYDFDILALKGHSQFVSDVRGQISGKLLDLKMELENCTQLGHSRVRDCELDKAHEAYNKCLEFCRQLKKTRDDSVYADILGNLGRVYFHNGKINLARTNFSEVVTTLSKKHGNKIVLSLWMIRLGEAEKALGNYAEAKNNFTKANESLCEYENSRWQLMALSNLAEVHRSLGNIEQSRKYFEDALQLAKTSKNHFGEAVCCYKLGFLEHSQKDFVKAEEYYNRVLSLNIKSTFYSTFIKLGILSLKDSNQTHAIDFLNRGIELCQDILKSSKESFEARVQLALGFLVLGKHKEATEIYSELARQCKEENIGGVREGICSELKLLSFIPSERRPKYANILKLFENEQTSSQSWFSWITKT